MHLTVLLFLPSLAWSWPADTQWVPLPTATGVLEDSIGDNVMGDASLDIVGDSVTPAGAWYADETSVYLRMQVNGDPMSGATFKPQDYAWLIDINGDDAADTVIASEGLNADLVVYSMNGTPGMQPGFAAFTAEGIYGSLSSGEVRSTLGPVSTWFVDVQITRADLAAASGIGDQDPLRVAVAAGPSVFFDWYDTAACAGVCPDLPSALSDTQTIDLDLDGWTDPFEAEVGTDPLDGDSDDDGVLDGQERDGNADGDAFVDALDCDSDADGILDGTEYGLTLADLTSDTDVAVGCFVADEDTVAPPTDPYNQDTDSGGLEDGIEDWNANGRIDDWETDPNDAADDVDSDGDGIADTLELQGMDGQVIDTDSDGDGITDATEWLYDSDGDGVPNFLDLDSDGDGIDDATEGDGDTDGDGIPDYLDDDSDGDGIPDSTEGGGDTDGDGTPDAQDTDSDGDGIPDSEEGAGDSDGDGIPDFQDDDSDGDGIPDSEEGTDDPDGDGVPNYLDDDSDGDGIPDSEEGTEDSDCDGIPDYLDPDNEDGFCDEGQTTPGTNGNGGLEPGEGGLFTGDGQWTGGACNSAPGGLWWWPILASAALALRRRRRVLVAAGLPALVASGAAQAQTVNAQRFTPATDTGPFMKLLDADPGSEFAGSVGLWGSYADDPLVYRSGEDETRVLANVATSHLTGSFGLGGVRVGAAVPVHLYTSGINIDSPTQLGDLRLTAEGEVVSAGDLRLGSYLNLNLPTGSQLAWVGAGSLYAQFGAIAAYTSGPATVVFNLGVQNGTGSSLGDLSVSTQVASGLGASLAFNDRLSTALEIDREDWLANAGERGAHPFEWLVSGRMQTGADRKGALSIGAGAGLSQGVGAPDFRVVSGYTLRMGGADEPEVITVNPATAEAEPSGDAGAVVIHLTDPRDDVGTGQLVIRVIDPTGRPIPGADIRVIGQGLTPRKAGPDGILEASVNEGAHEISVVAKGWGAEVRAVAINEGDTRDVTVLLRPDEDVVVDADAGRIFLKSKVFFEVDQAELKVDSLKVLDKLAEALLANEDVARVRVEGHTDVTGSDEHNLELSEARAAAVVAYLVKQGVSADRLEAKGYGESRPLQAGDSDEVNATNRRVEFHIL